MFSDEYTSTTNCWGIHLSLYHRFVNLFLFTSSQCLNWVWNLINIINSELWCWLCKSCFLLAKVLITPCSMRSCEQLPCSRVPYTLTAVTWYLHSDNTIFVMFSPFWRQDKRQIYFWCVWYFFMKFILYLIWLVNRELYCMKKAQTQLLEIVSTSKFRRMLNHRIRWVLGQLNVLFVLICSPPPPHPCESWWYPIVRTECVALLYSV